MSYPPLSLPQKRERKKERKESLTQPPKNKSHRVIATGGTLGGFKGKILRRDGDGITLAEKRTLLRREGVKLEGDGEKLKVLGTAFRGFV